MNPSHTTTNTNELTQFKVQWIFRLLGIAFLLPWNSFISASSYFESRSQNSVTTGSSNHTFMLWFGFLYNASGFVTLIAVWIHTKRTNDASLPTTSTSSTSSTSTSSTLGHPTKPTTVSQSFLTYIIIMVLNAILSLIPSPQMLPSLLFQIVSLLSGVICGISGAFLSIGIVAFTSTFPHPHWSIGPYITGQAMGGVVLSALDLSMQYHFHHRSYDGDENDNDDHDYSHPSTMDHHDQNHQEDDNMGTFVYFMTGSFFLFVCWQLYLWLEQQQVQQQVQVVQQQHHHHHHLEDIDSFTTMYEENDLSEPLLLSTNVIPQDTTNAIVTSTSSNNITASDTCREEEMDSNIIHSSPTIHQEAWNILKPISISICVCFFVTITIFPSWITELKSTHNECSGEKDNRWTNDLFVPLFIVLFNTFDLFGRTMAGLVRNDSSQIVEESSLSSTSTIIHRFKIGSFARMAMLPFFWFLNTNMSNQYDDCSIVNNTMSSRIFKSDIFAMALSTIFAFTNGWISSGGFILANLAISQNDHDDDDYNKKLQEAASVILNFSVGLGLLGGSLFSFVFHSIGKIIQSIS